MGLTLREKKLAILKFFTIAQLQSVVTECLFQRGTVDVRNLVVAWDRWGEICAL